MSTHSAPTVAFGVANLLEETANDITNPVDMRTIPAQAWILSFILLPRWKSRQGTVNKYKPEGICACTTHIMICQFNSVWESSSKGFKDFSCFFNSSLHRKRGVYRF